MKTSSKIHGAVVALVALVGLVVLAQGCSSTHGNASTPGTLICGYFSDIDDNGKVTKQPEYYRISAMNRKLAYYPEFAAAAGAKQVTDCSGARNVYRAYLEFLEEHPGFDNNQPQPPLLNLDDLVRNTPAPVSGSTVHKIYNGIQTVPPLSPVVRLEYETFPNAPYFDASGTIAHTGHSCTGSFIAKNWIITAAHCIKNIALQTEEGSVNWLTTFRWDIGFADEIGQVIDSTGDFTDTTPGQMHLITQAISIVDGNYMGVMNPAGLSAAKSRESAAHDVALLYLPPENNDGVLPPEMVIGQTALAISIMNFDPIMPSTAYGYGPNPNSIQPMNLNDPSTIATFQTSAPFAGVDNLTLEGPSAENTRANLPKQLMYNLDGVVIQENIPTTAFSFASPCHGDSGGPLVADFSTSGQAALTIEGIVSRHSGGGLCSTTPGSHAYWVNVASEQSFIEGSMQSVYGSDFKCNRLPDDGSDPTYMECWTTQCTSSCDCGPKSFCNNPTLLDPSSPFQNGTACTSCEDGTCGCVVGECLPRPPNIYDASDPVFDGGCNSGGNTGTP